MGILILISGIIDYLYRKIPNFIVLMIFCWALLFSSVSVYERLAGFLVTAVPLFIFAFATKKMKGGDYKFLVACATALGLTVFIKIFTLSVIFAFVWSFLNKEKSVPLAFVFMSGYILFLIL